MEFVLSPKDQDHADKVPEFAVEASVKLILLAWQTLLNVKSAVGIVLKVITTVSLSGGQPKFDTEVKIKLIGPPETSPMDGSYKPSK